MYLTFNTLHHTIKKFRPPPRRHDSRKHLVQVTGTFECFWIRFKSCNISSIIFSSSFRIRFSSCLHNVRKYFWNIYSLKHAKSATLTFSKHNFLVTLIRLSYLNCTRPRPGPGLTWCSICCGAWRWTWSRTRGGCSGTSPRRPRLHPPDILILCVWVFSPK